MKGTMIMKFNYLIVLLFANCVFAQNIVLKSSFFAIGTDALQKNQMYKLDPIDANEDGNLELPVNVNGTGWRLLDLITMTLHPEQLPGNCRLGDYTGNSFGYSNIRQIGRAEIITIGPCAQDDLIRVIDAYTGDVVFTTSTGSYFVYDYDQDGLDDLLVLQNVGSDTNVSVFGVNNGNNVSPPQELNIQISSNDYLINWGSVPTATAFRVLWSSNIDGIQFTRIGYTTATSFTHKNQADQPMGFYRVMSEDNGTGVVRLVGSTR
jgi:hypothetical protein